MLAPNRCSDADLEDAIPRAYKSPLYMLFFSRVNLNTLQQAIRYDVYVKSGGEYVIGPQSETELLMVMRNVFENSARHLPDNVRGQVRELNAMVVRDATGRIVPEIDHWRKYVKSLSTPPVNNINAQASSIKGQTAETEIFRLR